MENGKQSGAAVAERDRAKLPALENSPGETPPESPATPSEEYRVNRIVLHVTLGKWRGRLPLHEASTRAEDPPVLFAKGDDLPLPWGRALEELLAELLAKAEAAGP